MTTVGGPLGDRTQKDHGRIVVVTKEQLRDEVDGDHQEGTDPDEDPAKQWQCRVTSDDRENRGRPKTLSVGTESAVLRLHAPALSAGRESSPSDADISQLVTSRTFASLSRG